MIEITHSHFAKNLETFLNIIEYKGEEIILTRNKHQIARIIPGLKLIVFGA